jgi:flagellar hook-basal body complex protein FliE
MAIPAISLTQVYGNQAARQVQQPTSATSSLEQTGKTFEQMLSALNDSQVTSDGYVEKLAMGESVDLHDVMLNLEQNDVNFRVTLAIRDHLVDAYREMMRMQV